MGSGMFRAHAQQMRVNGSASPDHKQVYVCVCMVGELPTFTRPSVKGQSPPRGGTWLHGRLSTGQFTESLSETWITNSLRDTFFKTYI